MVMQGMPPSWKVTSFEDRQRYFLEQCERCGVDYFDVYLLHWLNQENYAIAEKFDEFGFLSQLKAEGKIGKSGFSYHGDAATLEKILSAHPEVDVIQLQINYLDWDDPSMEAHKCYDIAAGYGKEIVVMEPIMEASAEITSSFNHWATSSDASATSLSLPVNPSSITVAPGSSSLMVSMIPEKRLPLWT